MWDGKIASVFAFAVLASALAGRIVAARYRKRVVLLFDRHTDRAAAQAAIGAGSPRFVWFDANRLDNASAEAVLANLLDAPRT